MYMITAEEVKPYISYRNAMIWVFQLILFITKIGRTPAMIISLDGRQQKPAL